MRTVDTAMTTTRASDIRSRRVRWLSRGRLALGYLGVWTGPGDIGKSLYAAYMAKGITLGELDGEYLGSPQAVLFVATEDGREDMWKPRLCAVDADLDRVHFLDIPEGGWNVRDGIDLLAGDVEDTGAVFVFIDAAMEHMPPSRGGENINSPTFVRGALEPLRTLSRERGIASLIGLHPPKAHAETFADTVQASGAFTQVSRTGLMFSYHPDDRDLPPPDQRRIVIRGKGNAGRDPGALAFRIDERLVQLDDGDSDLIGYVTDVQPCDITIRQLLRADRPQVREADEREPSKAEHVEQLILERLADGEWHDAMREELIAAGYSGTTVDRARKKLCQPPRKQPGAMTAPWLWRLLPEHATRQPDVCRGDFAASRGGSPNEMRALVTSIGIPNKHGSHHLTHETDEPPDTPDEVTISHKARNTPRARTRNQLTEDETAAALISIFDATDEHGNGQQAGRASQKTSGRTNPGFRTRVAR